MHCQRHGLSSEDFTILYKLMHSMIHKSCVLEWALLAERTMERLGMEDVARVHLSWINERDTAILDAPVLLLDCEA